MQVVQIIAGSPSDLPYLWESRLAKALEEQGLDPFISACSAHRNLEDLGLHIQTTWRQTAVYVCIAGWAAALPGTVRALLLPKAPIPVFGIALPSEQYPDGEDAEVSITRLPPGVEVTYGGVGTKGLDSITDQVCELAAAFDPVAAAIAPLRPTTVKPPQFDIQPPWKIGV